MENKSFPPNGLDSTNDDAGKAEPQILSYPALIIDYAICDKYLKDWDATPEQKQEFADKHSKCFKKPVGRMKKTRLI